MNATAVGVLDYEVRKEIFLRLRAEDGSGLTHEEDLVVNIRDVNDQPTMGDYTFKVSKHSVGLADCRMETFCVAGSSVGQVFGYDQDGDSLDYEIVEMVMV